MIQRIGYEKTNLTYRSLWYFLYVVCKIVNRDKKVLMVPQYVPRLGSHLVNVILLYNVTIKRIFVLLYLISFYCKYNYNFRN